MKKFLKFFVMLLVLFFLVGCGKDAPNGGSDRGTNDNSGSDSAVNYSDRIVVYKVNMQLTVDNINDTYFQIKEKMYNDEWFDFERQVDNTYTLVIRVKSNHLDDFVNELKKLGEVKKYEREATDISLTYKDNENRIKALEAEIERLNELYERANLNDMIYINQRLTQLTLELDKLKSTLNTYDSQVEYSTINLTLTLSKKVIKEEDGKSYFTNLKNAFLDGASFLIMLLEGFSYIFVTILPIAAIVVPIIIVLVISNKKKKAKLYQKFKNMK